MSEAGLYEADIFEWSERQAEVLRVVASRRDLPNELDLLNIAEEIEGGRLSLWSMRQRRPSGSTWWRARNSTSSMPRGRRSPGWYRTCRAP